MSRIPPCEKCKHAWHGLPCKAIGSTSRGLNTICDCPGPFGDQSAVLDEGPKTESTKGKW